MQTHRVETAPEVYFTLGGGDGSEKTKRQRFVTWWYLAGGELERQLEVHPQGYLTMFFFH